MALATLRSLNATRMAEMVRLRMIRSSKRQATRQYHQASLNLATIQHKEDDSRLIIRSLTKRLGYEIEQNQDFFNVVVDGEMETDFDDSD